MNTSNVILAAKANSGKSTNNVWVVYTSDNSSDKMYCTSAYKAMRLAFLLKKRMGLNISDNCLARLSQEIAKAKDSASRVQNTSSLECSAEAQPVLSKGATAPTAQEVQKQEPVTAPVEEKPKKRRGRKPKAEKAA